MLYGLKSLEQLGKKDVSQLKTFIIIVVLYDRIKA